MGTFITIKVALVNGQFENAGGIPPPPSFSSVLFSFTDVTVGKSSKDHHAAAGFFSRKKVGAKIRSHTHIIHDGKEQLV